MTIYRRTRPLHAVAGSLALLIGLTASANAQLDVDIANEQPAEAATVPSERKIELVRERYPNRSVKVEREVTQDDKGNYINHGKWTYQDLAGKTIAEGRYRDHKRQGVWHRVHRRADSRLLSQAPFHLFTGLFHSTATFEDGKLHGTWTITDGKQRKVCEIQFDHGSRHGRATWWLPSGGKMRETTYSEGVIDGKFNEWSIEGKLLLTHTYQQGRRLALKTQHHSDTQKKSEAMYLFAKVVAKTNDDWWNLRMATYTTVGKDERHGEWTSWYQSGQLKQQSEFAHDSPVGESVWWFSNGQTAANGCYDDGSKSGRWVWWHTNGQKQAIGHFQSGASTGRWSWWRQDGRLVRSETHSESGVENVTIAPTETPKVSGATPKQLESSRRNFKR